MIGIYALILTIAALAGYGLFELYSYMNKKNATALLSGPGEDSKQLNLIMGVVYNQAQMGKNKSVVQNQVSKVLLMEDLNLRPKELKRYLGILQSKNLIRESLEYVTITAFGVQFYQVFQNDKLNLV